MNKKIFGCIASLSLASILAMPTSTYPNDITTSETIQKKVEVKQKSIEKILVLEYHNITNDNSPIRNNRYATTVSMFEKQMNLLNKKGYKTLTMEEFYKSLEEFRDTKSPDSLEGKLVLLTFDDGYKSVYENAYPILKKNNMKATAFIIGASIGNSSCLTINQLIEMRDVFDIEGHTYNGHRFSKTNSTVHSNLFYKSEEEIEKDLTKSSDFIREIASKEIIAVAWPGGDYNKKMISAGKKAGYKLFFKAWGGPINKNSIVEEIPRIEVYGYYGETRERGIKTIEDFERITGI
jgi:peptidoglycan/xylan/chitin deacetylase (PgdA/CDA1 family)